MIVNARVAMTVFHIDINIVVFKNCQGYWIDLLLVAGFFLLLKLICFQRLIISSILNILAS
jgi:hypothetical protein